MSNYQVVEEAGMWYVGINGMALRKSPHFTPEQAESTVRRLEKDDQLWTELFVQERRVAEALQPRGWPYGATCEKHSGVDGLWVLTEPYRNDKYSTRAVHPDPTGLVQVGVYDRERYEIACAVLDLAPHSDSAIQEKFQTLSHMDWEPGTIDVLKAVSIRLAFRRSIGIHVEEMEEKDLRAQALDRAGLLIDQYTRDQYETACEIMGVTALTDDRATLLVTLDVANDAGIHVTVPGLPNDPISVSLAYSRAIGISQEAKVATAEEEK